MARVHYDVYQVDYTAAILHEQMGTKEKFWYREGSPFDAKTLFKAGRPNTGENWAEVISAQIATAIKLPSAEYQFAECRIQQDRQRDNNTDANKGINQSDDSRERITGSL